MADEPIRYVARPISRTFATIRSAAFGIMFNWFELGGSSRKNFVAKGRSSPAHRFAVHRSERESADDRPERSLCKPARSECRFAHSGTRRAGAPGWLPENGAWQQEVTRRRASLRRAAAAINFSKTSIARRNASQRIERPHRSNLFDSTSSQLTNAFQ